MYDAGKRSEKMGKVRYYYSLFLPRLSTENCRSFNFFYNRPETTFEMCCEIFFLLSTYHVSNSCHVTAVENVN